MAQSGRLCHVIYAVIASNWDFSLGYAGLFNFGHLTIFATGVYTAAIAAKTFGVNPWLAIPMGGCFTAALVALIVAARVARLKGIYVVLVPFAFSQLVLQLIRSQSQITDGSGGRLCRKFRERLSLTHPKTQLSSESSKLRKAVTLHIELFLLDHLSHFDAFERGSRRIERFEPEHRARSWFGNQSP